MAACLAAPRASLLPQAPGKQAQAAAALAPRASPRVLAARPQRATSRRAMTVTAMAASELRGWQSHGLIRGCTAAWHTTCKCNDVEACSCTAVSHRPPIGWEHPPGRPSCRSSNARIHHPSASPPTPRTELIDGKSIAEDIRKELKAEVEQLKAKYGKVGRQALQLIGGGGVL